MRKNLSVALLSLSMLGAPAVLTGPAAAQSQTLAPPSPPAGREPSGNYIATILLLLVLLAALSYVHFLLPSQRGHQD